MAPRRPVAAAILAVAALAVYSRSFGVPFLFDDLLAIPENPRIHALATSLASPADTTLAGRPVASLSFALNHAAGGLEVAGYHAVNLVLHVLCAWLVYGVVRRLSRADGPALATALLWTVHSLATEAVVYVVQRTELLMALFLLGTLYAFLRATASQRPVPWYAASVAACAVGMGCKEVMVAAPRINWPKAVRLTVKVTNVSGSIISWTLPDACPLGIVVKDSAGSQIASDPTACIALVTSMTLKPGESARRSFEWAVGDDTQEPPTDGREIRIHGVLRRRAIEQKQALTWLDPTLSEPAAVTVRPAGGSIHDPFGHQSNAGRPPAGPIRSRSLRNSS